MPTTAETLQNYHPFSEDIIQCVDEIANKQKNTSWVEYLESSNVPDIEIFHPDHSKPIEILDIRPVDHDGDVIVYHEAMATSLDPNSIMHIMPLAQAMSTKRIIGVGNPGRPGQGYGKLNFGDRRTVGRGNLRPTVDPLLEYLNREGLEEVSHVGYSYGAEKVQAAAQFSDKYDLKIPFAISMDPPAVKDRGVILLGRDFLTTDKYLDDYISSTESTAYIQARKESGSALGYSLGLLRLSNFAIARSISKEGFEGRAEAALIAQPEMMTDVMWGSESEIAIDILMQGIVRRLSSGFGSRLRSTRFMGQKYAMCDDIFFHTAMVLHGIEQVAV